jgi:ADP-heptose:LPS heptosyltransferase
MRPEPLAGSRRVLVARLDNVGDVVCTGPVFRNLRAALRGDDSADGTQITLGLFASPAGTTAAPLIPDIDEVITWRAVWQDLGGHLPLDPARELELVARLRAGAWDAILILTSQRQTAWPAAYAAYLAGIPVRAGFADDFGGSVLSHPVAPPAIGTHQAERNLALLEGLGAPLPAGRDLRVRVPTDATLTIDARLTGRGIRPGEAILVVPGASAPARRMDASRFGQAAELLGRATDRPVIVATTPRERELRDSVLGEAPSATSIGDDLSVPEYAALVGAAALVVCGNSSALHLADALRRPVVAAYSGTDRWSEWRPRSSDATKVAVSVGCSPCYRIECPIGNACLAVEPEAIAEAGIALLAGRAPRPVRPALAVVA